MKLNKKTGYTYGLLSGFFWAVNAALISYLLLESIIPNNIVGYGIVTIYIACIHDSFSAITIYFINIKNKENKIVINKYNFLLVLSGILAGPIGLSCYMTSIKYLGVGVATSTVAIYPVAVAVLSIIFLKDKLKQKTMYAIMITVIGCIGINYFSSEYNSIYDLKIGLSLAIICVLSWAFESIVVDYLSKNNKNNQTTNMMFFIRQASSAVFYFIIIISFMDFKILVLTVENRSYLALIFITSLFATLSYLLWYKSISILGAPVGTMLNVTYCFWGVIFGVFVFHQDLSLQMVLCLFLIVGGIFTLLNNQRKEIIIEDR